MLHGIKTNILTTGTRPIMAASLATIGLLCTATAAAGAATAALDAAFPLNTPILVSNIRDAIGKAGTGGTLKPALEAIADQTSPILIVVRVAHSDDAAVLKANLIGTSVDGVYTGAKALLDAQAQTGQIPRILGAPGLDEQDVAEELTIIAKRLRAMVYAAAVGDDIADAVTYRENFSDRELMLIWPGFTGDFAGDAVARAMGLRARLDEEIGWHKTISNVAVDGVTGITKSVWFDLQDSSSDAGVLNAGDITTIIRREGFRFWGNRTCSDEPMFAFESAVRTSQALQDEIADGTFIVIDKPLTATLIKDVIETINARFRGLIARGWLIGAEARFDPALNPAEDLAAGKLVIDYDFTPAAPLEGLELNQRITDRYYASFADQITA